MTEGTFEKSRWHSERLGREVTLARWGHFGQPVLVFPTAGGDAEEIERFLVIRVLQPLISAGRIKVYSCDSVAGRAWFEQEGSPEHRMWLQHQFHQYVKHEVVPAIRLDCKSDDVGIWATNDPHLQVVEADPLRLARALANTPVPSPQAQTLTTED